MKEIPLTQGRVALVDDRDFDRLSQYNWQVAIRNHTAYAAMDIGGRRNRKRIYMHRMIMDAPDNMTVDHINGDGLDNRRENLRLATRQQNVANRLRTRKQTHSKYRGVFLAANKRLWFAQIVADGQSIYLGSYRTQREAAIAYNEAALQHFGEFAYLNTIPDAPEPDDQPFPEPPAPTNLYKGVKKQTRGGWSARVHVGGAEIHLGTYATPEEAARVRDNYIIEHGLNRPLNFAA